MVSKVLVKVKRLSHFDEGLLLPSYQSLGAAGCDIKVSLPDRGIYLIKPYERALLPTGLSFEIPFGYEIQIRPRSGISLKTNLMIVNSPGTIDSDYRGELKIIVGNLGSEPVEIPHGMRIAQMVLAPVIQAGFVEVDELEETLRGKGGFGSTGVM